MMTDLDTVRRFLAGTHSNSLADVEVIDTTVAEAIVCHGFPGFPNGELAGREAYKTFFRVFQASFSEMDFDTVALYEVACFVSAHWSCEATFSGEFAGITPDRRRVHFDGVAVYRMENGLIAETWLSFPVPMLMAQLPVSVAKAA
jgi:predicted ester cyclase